MKNLNPLVLTFFFCTLFILNMSGQDIHFSQYNYSTLTLNPALTGAYKPLQATIQYKQQWKVVNGYSTGAVSFEWKIKSKWKKKGGLTSIYQKKSRKGFAIGTYIFTDKSGNSSISHNEVNISIAYHAMLTRNVALSGGLIGGIGQLSINPEDLRWNSQYSLGNYNHDAASGENYSTRSVMYKDFGAGLLWSYGEETATMSSNDLKHFEAGMSVAHINQPKVSFYENNQGQLNRKWTVHGNTLIGVQNTNFAIGGSLLFMQQGSQKEITAGLLVKYKLNESSTYTGFKKESALSVGVFFRNRDALIPHIVMEMDKYAIGISYDLNISGFKVASTGKGGFEISVRFNTPNSFLNQKKK